MAGGAGRIGLGDRLQLQRADNVAALAERHDVAVHRLQLRELDAWKREELVPHPLEMLGDDVEAPNAAAGDECRRRDPRPNSRWGSWRAWRGAPLTAASASSKVGQASASMRG